jgi:hypothetical protein
MKVMTVWGDEFRIEVGNEARGSVFDDNDEVVVVVTWC